MDAQQEDSKIKIWIKILFWIAVLVFFIYSYQSIILMETTNISRRTEQFIRVLTALSKPNLSDSETNRIVAIKMLETFQIAFLATTISMIFAIPITILIARPSSGWRRGLNLILQPILAAIRAVHPLITVIPVIVFSGINSRSGVIALSVFSTAMLIGILSDYSRQHTSLDWSRLLRVHYPGLAFKYFPINILIASVLGFFGGGGIGFFLQQSINLFDYHNVSTAILACIIVIGGVDLISRAVWNRVLRNGMLDRA